MSTLDDVRTAHSDGKTFASYYAEDGGIVTAGVDGDVHNFPALYEEETSGVSLGDGQQITAMTVQDDICIIANSVNEVKSYKLPELSVVHSILMRFTAAVNSVAISSHRKFVAAASSDFSIQSVDMEGQSRKIFNGHEGPVLSVCFNQQDTKLVSNSCDGTVRVWDCQNQECVKSIAILPRIDCTPKFLGSMSLNQKLLAVPHEKTIKFISAETWKSVFEEVTYSHEEKVSCCIVSECSGYVASASTGGQLVVWNLHKNSLVKKFVHGLKKGITSLCWKKDGAELLFATDDGEVGTCEVEIPNTQTAKSGQAGKAADDNIADLDDITTADLDNDLDDDDILVGKKSKKRTFDVDDEDDDDEVVSSAKKHRINNMDNLLMDEADVDDDDDDDPNISLNLLKEGLLPKLNPRIIEEDDDSRDSPPSARALPQLVEKPVEYPPHAPFQPSATPAHLRHRYMVWNTVGIVRCHSDDEGVSSIDVEFHNTNTHHPLHLANVNNYTLATLTPSALLLATPRQQDTPSKLTCHHFSSWDSNNKEWSISLAKDEDIQAIASNRSHVCMATSKRLLRILTVGGCQTQLFTLPGPPVAMAMHDKQLIVVYTRSSSFEKCHCLGMLHVHMNKVGEWNLVTDHAHSLRENITITWLGFSAEGSPVFVDSSGDVFLWQRKQLAWIPIANTKQQVKNKSDNFWVISLHESEAKIRCILCKGASIPATLPRPIPTTIPFQLPLCEPNNQLVVKEHDVMRNNLLLSNAQHNQSLVERELESENYERQQLSLLMQLFALACKSDHDFRAIEVCRMMPSADSIALAIKYATQSKRMHLAKKLDEIARERSQAHEEEEEEEDLAEEEEDFFSDNDDFKVPVDEDEKPQQENEEEEESQEEATPSLKLTLNRRKDDHSQVTSNQTQQKPDRKARGNPFKVVKLSNESSLSRATERFENLQPVKKKTSTAEDSLKKKTTTGSKSLNIPSKNKKQMNLEANPPKKKVTGFQKFLEEKQLNHGDGNSEDVLHAAMKEWKELSKDEKSKWNGVKSNNNSRVLSENNNTKLTAAGANKPATGTVKPSAESKSKLSAFAFNKA